MYRRSAGRLVVVSKQVNELHVPILSVNSVCDLCWKLRLITKYEKMENHQNINKLDALKRRREQLASLAARHRSSNLRYLCLKQILKPKNNNSTLIYF